MLPNPLSVNNFWFPAGFESWQEFWFKRDDALDAEIRHRFSGQLDPARQGEFDSWRDTAEGALALVILLDQFPRNLFRGEARAFHYDEKAREVASMAVTKGLDQALPATARTFLYLPFEHSESMADQERSVALFEGLRDHPPHGEPDGSVDYAWRHHAVIRLFGRFPHRNKALGRINTPEEEAYLAQPGAGF